MFCAHNCKFDVVAITEISRIVPFMIAILFLLVILFSARIEIGMVKVILIFLWDSLNVSFQQNLDDQCEVLRVDTATHVVLICMH